jgi:hypothetical protein
VGNATQVSETLPPPPNPIPHYDIWLLLADCESGSDWDISTGNGYYGGLQFAKTSWDGADGQQFTEWPHEATPVQQMMTAEVLLDMQGWGAWPACSKRLGLR